MFHVFIGFVWLSSHLPAVLDDKMQGLKGGLLSSDQGRHQEKKSSPSFPLIYFLLSLQSQGCLFQRQLFLGALSLCPVFGNTCAANGTPTRGSTAHALRDLFSDVGHHA